jgi:hypothetical protein
MLACDSSIAPHDFASDKSYCGQLCLSRRADRSNLPDPSSMLLPNEATPAVGLHPSPARSSAVRRWQRCRSPRYPVCWYQ